MAKKRGRPAKKKVEETKEVEEVKVEVTKTEEPKVEETVEETVEEVKEVEEANFKFEDVAEGVEEEPTVEETILSNRLTEEGPSEEEKVTVMNKEKFEKELENKKPYVITQDGKVLANYSVYLQVEALDNCFMLFNKKYSYINVKVEKKK